MNKFTFSIIGIITFGVIGYYLSRGTNYFVPAIFIFIFSVFGWIAGNSIFRHPEKSLGEGKRKVPLALLFCFSFLLISFMLPFSAYDKFFVAIVFALAGYFIGSYFDKRQAVNKIVVRSKIHNIIVIVLIFC
ncbi:MAG: hypothetical protein V1867_02495 [Candidatus Falkowbacteria bacterium]